MNAFAPRPPHAQGHARAAADELLRAELTELLPPPPVPEPAPGLRHTVLRTALAGDGPDRRPSPVRRPGFRLAGLAAPVVACAMVAGVAVFALQEAPAGGPDRSQVGQRAPGGAGQVLTRAALAAAAAPPPDVRADGYVYVRSLVAHAGRAASGGAAALPAVHRREVWLSADGSRAGLLREPGAADVELGARAPVYELDHRGATPRKTTIDMAPPSVTHPTHAYVATLPTDPDALLRLIRAETGRAGGDTDQRAFTAIGTLLAETWAPPKVTAALYEAAARVPGVTVLPSAKDAAGREGVAVARTSGGAQTQWIFDRATSAFLGERTVLTEATSAGPAGTVLGVSAVLAKAAATAPGELPGAARA
ncbi:MULTISPECIES: CU044_5270 family protein [unclassified Streptomyces]|uniref:CU044_5270 family protein n=1 Tax=unclassified Streptomyces TaxID=2593676 RepID=UPI0037F87C0E